MSNFLKEINGVPRGTVMVPGDLPTITLTSDVTGSGSAGSITTTIAPHVVINSKIAQRSARSVMGNSGNTTADVTDIQGTANQVLVINSAGTSLGFGAVNLASSAAVTGILANANTTATNIWNPNTIASRDAAGISNFTCVREFVQVNNTGSTATLNSATPTMIQFTGTSSNDCVLPDATTLVKGTRFWIINRSTGSITVKNNGGTLLATLNTNDESIFLLTDGSSTNGVWDITSIGSSGITALTGDVTASGSGSVVATIASNAVTNAKLAQMTAHTYKGNNTGSTANAADITSTQLTADLNLFTSSLQGLTPASGGGTTNFLRADGTWAAAGSGSVTSVAMTVPAFLSVAGSPITSSGTLAVTLSGTALPIANGGTGQTTANPAFNALSPLTTKGDLLVYTTVNARLPVGTDNQIIVADSTQTSGVKWASYQQLLTNSTVTSNTTMVVGTQYFTNGSSGALHMTLPATSNVGDIIAICGIPSSTGWVVYSNASASAQQIYSGSKSSLTSSSSSIVLVSSNNENDAVYLICTVANSKWNIAYLNDTNTVFNGIAATGGTITTYTSGGTTYKVHTFTSSGTFQITSGSTTQLQALVVAGGGGGGSSNSSGGGGAGGFKYSTGLSYGTGSYTVTVGAGGAGSNGGGTASTGSNSVFDTITSTGGGGGGAFNGAASAGGSGGGGGNPAGGAASPAGQGNAGGNGTGGSANNQGGGGGGGAGAVGGTGTTSVGGNGGNGSSNSITGSAVTYGGGGGGGNFNGTGGTGGTGGGGGGGTTGNGTAGTTNTGGGGGSGPGGTGGTGGSGIVIISYPT